MRQALLAAGLIVLALIGTTSVTVAQKATEVYIPIGESPGISEADSVVGTISDVDYADDEIEIVTERGKNTIQVDKNTYFYLDRSQTGERNAKGDMEDCKVGSKIEAYIKDDGAAAWIKIKAD